MRTRAKLAVLVGVASLGSGCMNEDYRRADGITTGAGDKLAGNTVMQMVDPWRYGVQDTDLLVPANRGSIDAAAAADAKQSQTTDSGGN